MSETTLEVASPTVSSPPSSALKVQELVGTIAYKKLSGLVADIDRKGLYPEEILRSLGEAGAYGMHLPGYAKSAPDLRGAIEAMQTVGEQCLSTSFCMWCQDALVWYIYNSDNEAPKARLGPSVTTGAVLGGTALSNPMKAFYAIEKLRLHGTKVPGGYRVSGLFPWVSNLGDDHYFGAIFEARDTPGRHVMALIDCSDAAVTLMMNNRFVALDGTRTFAVQISDLFIPDEMILADPIDAYLPKIRAGFVLLQAGMAFGIIQSSIDLMKRMAKPLGHVNKFLEEQPEAFQEELAGMKDAVWKLCETPYESDPGYWRDVLKARLAAGEATVKAAHAAMLHCGARGYVENGEAQRRLREAYFVAIVTPATKQLRKMLAEMAH